MNLQEDGQTEEKTAILIVDDNENQSYDIE